MKKAVIDIGSNSVRLMLWADGTTLYKKISTTRLGEGLAIRPVLREDAMARTAEAVARFAEEGRSAGADVCAFATAAVRTAENGAAFCALVRRTSGLAVDVVSGGREAELALCGALGGGDGTVLDIGGASTELCMRRDGKKSFAVSLDVGAVRLYDLCRDDPARLEAAMSAALSPLGGVRTEGKTYAVGGTATTLAALHLGLGSYDASAVQDCRLTLAAVEELTRKLLALSPQARKNLKGMDPRRADIIAGGAYLLESVMRALQLGAVFASDRDNLEGYLFGSVLS